MKAIATYCSADKNETQQMLPALELYRSERIKTVEQRAQSEKVPFFILSGKFGCIPGEMPIPYYDHLLKREELDAHTEKVSKQLLKHGIRSLHFFSRDPKHDPHLSVYLDCITAACSKMNVSLEITFLKER